MKTRLCASCHQELQNNNEHAIGYIPLDFLKIERPLFCKRCYDIKFHNSINDFEIDVSYKNILQEIKETNSLVILIIDILNYRSILPEYLNTFLETNNSILVINKIDLLPKSIKKEKILSFITNTFSNFKIQKIILTSTMSKLNIPEFIQTIETFRENRDVYLLGATNSGKSSLINEYIKKYTNKTEELIATSFYKNTTIRLISVPLGNNRYLYDTPGFSSNLSFYDFVDLKVFRYIVPSKEIKPIVYQINRSSSLLFGNLLKLDIITEKPLSIVIYMANTIKIKRAKTDLKNETYTNITTNQKEIFPIMKSAPLLSKYSSTKFRINKEKTDIYLHGLGFLTLRNGVDSIIILNTPYEVLIEEVETFI
ncbi:MAG: GTPase RsgA [Bacillales bacterium]|jgi:ribosome biogenesis GTPase YqeH|nr:GTPase RsgA [Bacillales bacterium]